MLNKTKDTGTVELEFSSTELLVILYTSGAVISMLSAFSKSLSALQSTNCLLISWFLALGALGISLLNSENAEDQEYE